MTKAGQAAGFLGMGTTALGITDADVADEMFGALATDSEQSTAPSPQLPAEPSASPSADA